MKNVLIIAILIVFILFTPNGFAQDYMKWGLPENAMLRLGKGYLYDIKHSPNGDLIAVASSIGVWLYNADSGKEIRLLQKHTDWVNSLTFSPNGKMLASCGSDGIHLWDPHTGRLLSTLNESPADTRNVVFSPDGLTLVSTSDKIIRFWDVTNGTISKTLTGHTWQILSIAVSPNGKTIVSGSLVNNESQQSNGLRWWDVETGNIMFSSTNVRVATALAFSPNGKILACADGTIDGQKIYLFNAVNGEILKTLREHRGKINSLTFSPDGKMLVSSGLNNAFNLWDSQSGQHIHTFRGHTDPVKASFFFPDGETLVSGSEDGTIRFWNTSTKQQRLSISGHWGEVEALAFSTDNKTLISGTLDATIHKWDIGSGQLTYTLTGRYGERILAFDMKNGLFASGSSHLEDDAKIYFRSIDTGKQMRLVMDSVKYPYSYKGRATFSHDGETFVWSPGEGREKEKVKFWNTFFRRIEFEFVPHEIPEVSKHGSVYDKITALSSSPDGNLLAIALGGIVSLWKFGTNEFIRLYPTEFGYLRGEALAFSSDSKTIAVGDGLDIRLIEVDTGNLIATLSGNNSGISALSFSVNGKLLASGSEDGTILIWDLDKTMKRQ